MRYFYLQSTRDDAVSKEWQRCKTSFITQCALNEGTEWLNSRINSSQTLARFKRVRLIAHVVEIEYLISACYSCPSSAVIYFVVYCRPNEPNLEKDARKSILREVLIMSNDCGAAFSACRVRELVSRENEGVKKLIGQ